MPKWVVVGGLEATVSSKRCLEADYQYYFCQSEGQHKDGAEFLLFSLFLTFHKFSPMSCYETFPAVNLLLLLTRRTM